MKCGCRRFWRAVLVTIVTLLAGCGAGQDSGPSRSDTQSSSEPKSSNEEPIATTGAQPYTQHCAACHGPKGDGKGIAAQYLFPKPRDFRAGRFRLVSTSNNVPTPEDIRTVLRRGMPGSSMPPWPKLNDDQVKLLA